MKLFVFTIAFLNKDFEMEYKVVEGVYDSKELAKEAAKKKIQQQQSMWEGSYTTKLGYGKVGLVSKDGCSKVYQIHEKELNK